jgi:predicted  nucleic acid-binding Zn-ribbon protein
LLLLENDSLICQNRELESHQEVMDQKLFKMGSIIKGKQYAVEQTEDENERLQNEVNDLQNKTVNIERELHAAQNDVANAQADADKINRNFLEAKRESDSILMNNSDLKSSIAEITERYQTHLKQSSAMALRERELIDEINTVNVQLEGT